MTVMGGSLIVKVLFVDHFLYRAILVVEQALNLQATEVGDVVGRYTVVIEQIPLSLILYDAVVSGPTNNRIQDDTLIGEWSIRIVTDGIAEEVAITSRITEIVLAVVLVHP